MPVRWLIRILRISLVYATFDDADQFSESCVKYFEQAFDQAAEEGKHIRALLLCSPHNPLGQEHF